MMAVGNDAGFSDPVCHIHHMDLISDPVSTVEGVYKHFGMELGSDATSAIETFVAAKPKGGYGVHTYHFEDHGLDEQQERARFRPYMMHFGVAAETAPKRRQDVVAERVSSSGEPTLH